MPITAIILKLASRCNLNCSYCYLYNHEDKTYLDKPKLISDRIFDATLDRISKYCLHMGPGASMALVFHGGEPTMIGHKRFDELATRAKDKLGPKLAGLAMQTNGVLVSEDWAEVLKRQGIHVGVSLDGDADVHDITRVDHRGRGSHARAVRGIQILEKHGVESRILCVVNPGANGADAYRYLRKLGCHSLDFLLPDVSHDNKAAFYGSYGDTPVADFLIGAFDAWFDEDDSSVHVRLFWDLIKNLLGGDGSSDVFGNPLMSYLIIDTDGAIEALDALRVCAPAMSQSGLNVLEDDLFDLHRASPLVQKAVTEGFALPTGCRACPERDICGGGYLPHRYSHSRLFDNPSVWCADIKRLLMHVRARVSESEGFSQSSAALAVEPTTAVLRSGTSL
jgi:uncharacterized protein